MLYLVLNTSFIFVTEIMQVHHITFFFFQHKDCHRGVAMEFDIHEKIEVTKSSMTLKAYAASKDQDCNDKSFIYFSYIACGTY